ncbi:RNA polymerase II subunit A, partial [Blastocladiella britannica]
MTHPTSCYTYAVVCASNMNRSMSAHLALKDLHYAVESYGTGTAVRLPGPSVDKPNVYPFASSTTYVGIAADLRSKDERLYNENGLLAMLARNQTIKPSPERWQSSTAYAERPTPFDVVFTCEERVFDLVCEDLALRPTAGAPLAVAVHVINVEIRDTAADAAVGARLIAAIAQELE